MLLNCIRLSPGSRVLVGRRPSISGNCSHTKYPFSNATVFSTTCSLLMDNNSNQDQDTDGSGGQSVSSELPSQREDIARYFTTMGSDDKTARRNMMNSGVNIQTEFSPSDPSSWSTREVREYLKDNNVSLEDKNKIFVNIEHDLASVKNRDIYHTRKDSSLNELSKDINIQEGRDLLNTKKEDLRQAKEAIMLPDSPASISSELDNSINSGNSSNKSKQSNADYISELQASEPMDFFDPDC